MVRHATYVGDLTNFDSIDKINEILMGKLKYSSIASNTLEGLDVFCEKFLSCTCCDDHEVSTRLAKLSVFLCIQPYLDGDDREAFLRLSEVQAIGESVRPIHDEKPDAVEHEIGQEHEVRQLHKIRDKDKKMVRQFFPATPIDFAFLQYEFVKDVLQERHRADIPRWNFRFDERSGREGTIIPLMHYYGCTESGSWQRRDRIGPGGSVLDRWEFRTHCMEEPAKLCWMEPANVVTYLGFLLAEMDVYTRGKWWTRGLAISPTAKRVLYM